MAAQSSRTLAELFLDYASEQPDSEAYSFLTETSEDKLSRGELDIKARSLAALLQSEGLQGERVLLMHPPGSDYLVALWACVLVGAVAVPLPAPRGRRLVGRLELVLGDSNPAAALAPDHLKDSVEELVSSASPGRAIRCLGLRTGDASAWRIPDIRADDLAVIQYTSGSTTEPRGVQLDHRNLLSNCKALQWFFRCGPNEQTVSWLPLYHDMGLILTMLQPVFDGRPCTLLAPADFSRRPQIWLETISKKRATVSGGPNFAFELAVARTSAEERAALDLSSWQIAFVGSEPINSGTLERFAQAFSQSGFRPEAFMPGYGLAEATLVVTARPRMSGVSRMWLDQSALELGKVSPAVGPLSYPVVGCGIPSPETKITIIDPDTGKPAAPDRAGEVVVSGPGVARGYFGAPERSTSAFQKREQTGTLLYTGDLGFISEGELYILGRRKDLLIFQGRNVYPQDIEWTAMQTNSAVVGAAAFSGTQEDELVVLVEAAQRTSAGGYEKILDDVRSAISADYEVAVSAAAVVRRGALFRTSSGKIQRQRCREAYLEGSLRALAVWPRKTHTIPLQPAEIRTRLRAWLSERLKLSADNLRDDAPLASYGLDSAGAVELANALGTWLGCAVSPVLLYQRPTIQDLSSNWAPASNGTLATGIPERREPIAIVGLACRLPGADNPAEFWRMLCASQSGISEVPPGRWTVDIPPDLSHIRRGGFLSSVDGFEPTFFGISGREALWIDPQQRLLLEMAWEALEDAGHNTTSALDQRVGVFAGLCTSDYGQLSARDTLTVEGYWCTGTAASMAANRLSYWLDFHGPSMTVDTACSSGLVAVNLACQALQAGRCEMALAGAANLILLPTVSISMARGNALALDGHCKTFSSAADGICRGEGAGMVVLKPLSLALSNGDTIYAVIRNHAINQDGASNGITAPNGLAQQQLLREVYGSAGLSGADVDYIEAHGTGTLLGDPIEAEALGTVLGKDRPPDRPLLIGSLKTNIGHLEAAAGIAGLIKLALMIRHGAVPASLHFDQPNPYIPFEQWRLRVNTSLQPWPEVSRTRRAGISAFGFGGTNAHLVLEAAPVRERANPERKPPFIVPLSAASESALKARLEGVSRWLTSADPQPRLHDVVHTAALRRKHFDFRAAVVAGSVEELAKALQEWKRRFNSHTEGKLALVFSGQSSKWPAGFREFVAHDPHCRGIVEQCDDIVLRERGQRLGDRIYQPGAVHDSESFIAAQVGHFIFQTATAAWLQARGLKPDAIVGHSLGEVAGACAAGALSLDEGVRVVLCRSQLMAGLAQEVASPGAMAAAKLSIEEAKAAIKPFGDRISIAAVNSPRVTVISGDETALNELAASLRKQGSAMRVLKLPGAGHSALLRSRSSKLVDQLSDCQPRATSIPYYSTVTADRIDGQALDARYWERNLVQPVLYAAAVAAMLRDGYTSFIEIAPDATLEAPTTQCIKATGIRGEAAGIFRKDQTVERSLFDFLCRAFEAGRSLCWDQLAPAGEVLPLPAYPWQRKRYYVTPSESVTTPAVKSMLGSRMQVADQPNRSIWETEIAVDHPSYLAHHRVHDVALLPMAAYVDLFLAATREQSPDGTVVLHDLLVHKALFLHDGQPWKIQLIADRTEDGLHLALYATGENGKWELHGSARASTRSVELPAPESLEDIASRCPQQADQEQLYEFFRGRGLTCGPPFRGLVEGNRCNDESLVRLCAPAGHEAQKHNGPFHPAVLESSWHALAWNIPDEGSDGQGAALVPIGVRRLTFTDLADQNQIWAHATLTSKVDSDSEFAGDVRVTDRFGQVWIESLGVTFRRVDPPLARPPMEQWFYYTDWKQAGSLPRPAVKERQRWLVFGPATGEYRTVSERLKEFGHECFVVEHGSAFSVQNGRATVRAEVLQDFEAVVAVAGDVEQVVFLWAAEGLDSAVDVAGRLGNYCAGVLSLIKAMARSATPVALWIVTVGAWPNSDARPEQLASGTLWPLGRVIAHEHQHIHCRLVDLPTYPDKADMSALLAELHQRDAEMQVQIRNGLRLVARLARATPTGPVTTQPPMYEHGTYLVTGGTGRLGPHICRWLAQHGAKRVVLVGRGGPHTSAVLQEAQTLAGDDVDVVFRRCDLGVASEVASLINELRNHSLPLRGIVHAASADHPAPLTQLDWPELRSVLACKALGAWHLHQFTRDLQLDFLILFSSAAALLGTPMQGYTAANGALSALAFARHAQDLPCQCVEWGPWAIAQPERDNRRREGLRLRGIEEFSPTEAFQALEWLLPLRLGSAAILPLDARRFGHAYPALAAENFWKDLWRPGSAPDLYSVAAIRSCPDLMQRRHLVVDYLRKAIAKMLDVTMDEVIENQPVTMLGLDSLSALELQNRIIADIGIDLPLSNLLEGPTVGEIAALLADQLGRASATGEPTMSPAFDGQLEADQADALLARMDQLTDEEIQTLLESVGTNPTTRRAST